MFSSTLRATALAWKRRDERARCRKPAANRRGGVAPLVSDCELVAALSRSLLLAHRADHLMGLHSNLPDAAIGFFCASRRHFARRGDAVGRVVPRPDRTR